MTSSKSVRRSKNKLATVLATTFSRHGSLARSPNSFITADSASRRGRGGDIRAREREGKKGVTSVRYTSKNALSMLHSRSTQHRR